MSEVRPSRPTGPRACSLSVEMPISAPRPYSKPSAKRVDGVDHHARRVDLAQEAHRVGVRVGDDRVGVVRAVAVDVGERGVEASTTLMLMIGARYSSLQSASLAATSFAPAHAGEGGARRLVAAHLDALLREHGADPRQERRGDRGVDEQRLGGVARAVLLRLGVVDDRERHRQVGVGVDVDVAVAVEVLDHRHLRLARDPLDQALAAARDDEVDRLRRGDQVADGGAVASSRPAAPRRAAGRLRRARPGRCGRARGSTPALPSRRAGCRRCRS